MHLLQSSRNFGDAVRAVAAAASPELLLIEPSGVAMASDVLSALKEPEEAGLCEVKGVVTLVDGEAAPMYIHNFGMFYKDQLKGADAVLSGAARKDRNLSCINFLLNMQRKQNSS